MARSTHHILFLFIEYTMLLRAAAAFVRPSRSPFVFRQLAAGFSTQMRMASTAAEEEKAAPAAPAQYPFAEVEKKWQAYWAENQTFKTPQRNPEKPKKYVLDMFPYPSGAGLHVGHPEGYTGKKLYSKHYGMNVFFLL